MARVPAPDPQWHEGSWLCARCSYDVRNLEGLGVCPECGTRFGQSVIELHGIRYAGKGGGPAWRKFAWAFVITGGLVLSQIGPVFIVMTNGLIYLGLLSVALLVVLVALVTTSRADRTGTRRILISEIGIAMLVPEGKREQSSGDGFREWQRGDFLRFKHVGRFWSTLDVLDYHDSRALRVGFRVSADDGPEIETMIRELLDAADPVEPEDAGHMYRNDSRN